jgi:hypothetical protein
MTAHGAKNWNEEIEEKMMKTHSRSDAHRRFHTFCSRLALPGVVLGLLLFAAPHLSAQSQDDSKDKDDVSLGLKLSKQAGPKEVGLPWYPGARLHKDSSDDTPALQFSFEAGSSEFKIAVLKLDSTDAPDKVAAFYRQALSKYGKILECTSSTKAGEKQDDSKSSKKLTCDSDDPKNGGLELKAGTPKDQHVAGIEPNGAGTIIQLAYIKLPKDSDKD